jgi:hypothetical protein
MIGALGPPTGTADQPSLGAAEPSGFTHDTCIQSPARAVVAVTANAHTSIPRVTGATARRNRRRRD